MKKIHLPLICSALFVLLVFTVVALTSSTPLEPEAKIYIAPPLVGGIERGSIFSVSIHVSNVSELYGIDLKLSYDTTYLDLVESDPKPPWSSHLIFKDEINEAEGVYWLAMAALSPASAYSGSTELVTLNFRCAGTGESVLHLFETQMCRSDGSLIPHNTNDGFLFGRPLHDVVVAGIWCNPRGGVKGISININVTVENQGLYTETFNVTVYVDRLTNVIGDEVILETQTVNELPAGESQVLTFVWVTTEALYGRYYVSAEASVVEGEIDIEDNFLIGGDWIGGIYMPSYVLYHAEIMAWTIIIFLMCAPLVYIKSYWHL